jgi:class 3 adenylate cyclase
LFFLSGSPRAVLVGVANLGVILLGTVIQVTMLSPSTPGIASVLGLNPLLIGLICGIYAIIGGFAAGVGAMWRLSRKDDEELMLSRHQLLERLFDFESRLVAAKDEGDKTRYLLPRRLIMPFRRWPVWSAVVCGIIIGGCQLVLGSGALSQGPAVGADAAMSARLSILLLLLVLLAGVVYFVSAFACDRLLTGLGRNLLMYLTSTAVALLPLNGYGPDFFVSNEFLTDRRVIFLFFLILSVLGFLMSRLEERVSVRARLDANDPAALLAEMVRIEWLLSARHQEVAVVSVDVARSTEMKANCDPLAAEYSFREYQNFIRNICHAAGGFVHSTAGDGAILAFPTAEKAFQAAREIQTGISYFNEHVNKMPAKFRLRVGIHMGETPDDIRQVEYTEVIDIASHVQEVAPIRGIVVTKPVAEHLPEEQLIQLRDPVEGFEVFLAHNPTVDM